MLNNIVFKYFPIQSYIHMLNPIIKVISIFLFIISIFISNNIFVNLLFTCLVLLIIFLSNISFKLYFKAVWKMKYFILMYIVISFICRVDIREIILIIIRFINLILYSFILTYTTKSSDITYALERIFGIFKCILPVKAICLIITLALQFIPILLEQTNKIMKSLASRGMDYKTAKLNEKWRILKAIIIPMFTLSFKRADEVADAYEVRYYSLKEDIVPFRESKVMLFDYFYLGIHIVLLILTIVEVIIL